MCYNVSYRRRKVKKYAEGKGLEFDESQFGDHFYANAFSRPDLPVVLDQDPGRILPVKWGLVPSWAKDSAAAKKLAAMTPNAMGETVFDKPAFKYAARNKRCLVVIDGFFEYHHAPGGKKVPYFISLASGEEMVLAGLWESWKNEAGQWENSVSIVTTVGNTIMSQIHNNPDVIQRTGSARMPLILPDQIAESWITKHEVPFDRKMIEEMITSYPDEELKWHTVASLQGKSGTGNTPQACERYEWNIIGLP